MYNFLFSRLIPHNTELTFSSEKIFDLHKTQFFNNVLKTFKFAAIRTSLPRFEVSRDVDSGTRDFIRLENKWEFCFRGVYI